MRHIYLFFVNFQSEEPKKYHLSTLSLITLGISISVIIMGFINGVCI